MIVALNEDLERTLITKRGIDQENFFCQLCGNPVYPTTIVEAPPKKRRRKTNLSDYIPIRKEMQFFVHKKRPCYRPCERETVEHIVMKLFVANELHELKPLIDYPIGNRLADIYLPDLETAIECQSSQITQKNMRSIINHYTVNKVTTTFIWGSRAFSRLIEADHRLEYYKLKSTVAEDTILSRVPIMSSEGPMREVILDSNDAFTDPRSYVYYKNNKLYWLHIFRKNRRLYLGTQHPFKGGSVKIFELNTDIGLIGLFQKRRQ